MIVLCLALVVVVGLVDGLVEGYTMGGRTAFEKWKGVKPISYFGSKSWLLAYKDNDVSKGHKSLYRKIVGARDFYHHAEKLRGALYIALGITLHYINIDLHIVLLGLIAFFAKSPFKKWALDFIRSKNIEQ